ncbi:hypothetical protein [Ardenticatena maritima]|uniref:Uncharacterized protein n=1 Tax=Ardenticatena maritima TaxID=872965 RepID=A0A0P6YFY7_9CHLR|nr:hypothetical protein [Ardenticatena maritima]KPL89253.1 hypothetical protein SE16_01855 [Ardenticatena maritima]
MNTIQRQVPGWLIDLLLVAGMIALSIAVERATQGRIANTSIIVWVGAVYFVLLRVGAFLARVGQTLGCLGALVMAWVLPCGFVGWLALSPDRQAMARDSIYLFALQGVFIIIVMWMTFERIRYHDQQRFGNHTG